MTKNPPSFRPRSRTLALEPRVLFDGAAAVVAADYFSAPQEQAEHGTLQARTDAAPATTIAPVMPASAPATLLVVDARVANYQSLLADLPANVTVRVVEVQESGLTAISASLGSGQRFDSVQIVSHGSAGSLTLGADTVNSAILIV